MAGEEQTIVFQAKNEQNELFEGRLKLGANVIHQNEPVNKPGNEMDNTGLFIDP